MTNCAKHLTHLIALIITVCTVALATVSCDKLPLDIEGIFGGQQDEGGDNTPPEGEQTPPDEEQPDECIHESKTEGKCDNCGKIFTITIAEAIEIAKANPAGTTQRYYIRATVVTISNPAYGEMTIQDETGEIYVYGTYSQDGSLSFPQIESTPVKGDEVLLHCILSQYEGTNQVKNARLIEFVHNEIPFDEKDYTEMTIAEARDAEAGAKVKVSGTVAQITYANGMKPSGIILVDGTSSIYVYGVDVAGQVKIGNTVTVAGEKTYWVLDSEISNAQKFGYKGSCQLDNATVISNDKGNTAFDKTWITETTVKEIIDTPVTENITNMIFKVNALVKKAPGNGFVNYYIDDIDGVTGSYVYTQCNGGDFEWLDEFDGKICTVYMVAQNAKSTASGCVWRLLPIEVIDEGYEFDTAKAAEFAVKYHGIGQFLNSYTGDPAVELVTSVSSELLGFEGATLTYSSSDEAVAYFTTDENGVVTFHCGNAGKATVTVTATHGENTFSETVEVVVVPNVEVEYIEVADAISAENNTTVTVKGIIGPSLVNQIGFYLIDSTGSIPVRVSSETMEGLAIGHEVIIQGTRTITKDGGGQICIDSATVVANYYGSNDYSSETFITGKTITEIYSVADSAEATTKVYVTTAKIYVNETQYSVTIQVQDPNATSTFVLLYSGGKDQYNWLKTYNGTVITIELALCDWNAKGLKGCVLAVVNEDGSKIYNELNFGN